MKCPHFRGNSKWGNVLIKRNFTVAAQIPPLKHTHMNVDSLELSEADAVVCLCRVHGHRFGYALANGIVGVYGGEERYWRIKVRR